MISQIGQNTSQTSFKRGFYTREMNQLALGNAKSAIDVGFEIGAGKIRPEDGAIKQLDHYLTRHPRRAKRA